MKRIATIAALRAPEILVSAVALAASRGGLKQLATVLGVSPRSIARRTKAFGLPTPLQILGHTTSLYLLWLLDHGGWTPKAVAVHAGFASMASFTHYFERWRGQPPVRLSNATGFEVAWREWHRVLEADWRG